MALPEVGSSLRKDGKTLPLDNGKDNVHLCG